MGITLEELAIHPGVIIKEEMEARGWIQRDLAFILGCTEQTLNPLLSGKRGISPEMAKALAGAFDVSAEFFLNLQKQYDLRLAQEPSPGVAIRANMQSNYPIREMIRRGWIEQSEASLLEAQLARFFKVSSHLEVPYLAHAAKKSRYEEREIPGLQLAWLFRVRQIAESVSAPRYSEEALRSALPRLEALLMEPEDAAQVPRVLLDCGLRFIMVEAMPGAKIDGVCFWLNDESPVVGLSSRFDRIDNFWFVLRHEIEHVLCGHGKEQREEIIDDLEGAASSATDAASEQERQANMASLEFCVPGSGLDAFIARKKPFYYEKHVLAFAALARRHPGLVVGQMQKRLDNHAYLRRHQVKIRHHVLPGAIADGWGQTIQISI